MSVDRDKPVIIDWKFRDGKDHPDDSIVDEGGFPSQRDDGEIFDPIFTPTGDTVVYEGEAAPFFSSKGTMEINPTDGRDSVVYEAEEREGEKGALVPAQLVINDTSHSASMIPSHSASMIPSHVVSGEVKKSLTELPVNDRPILYGPAGAVKNVRYCGAKCTDGHYCKKPAMKNGRCQLHGGKMPRGFNAPSFKHGKYSKYLPEGMKKQYERSMADPELLSLNNELSIIDTRLLQLIKRLDKGESGRLWLVAGELYEQLTMALRAGSVSDVNKKMMALGEVLKKGSDEYGLWKEIGESMDRRRSLSEAERRRLVDGQYMIDVEKAKTLIAALAASVRKHVTDIKALSAISEDFLRLTQGSASRTDKPD